MRRPFILAIAVISLAASLRADPLVSRASQLGSAVIEEMATQEGATYALIRVTPVEFKPSEPDRDVVVLLDGSASQAGHRFKESIRLASAIIQHLQSLNSYRAQVYLVGESTVPIPRKRSESVDEWLTHGLAARLPMGRARLAGVREALGSWMSEEAPDQPKMMIWIGGPLEGVETAKGIAFSKELVERQIPLWFAPTHSTTPALAWMADATGGGVAPIVKKGTTPLLSLSQCFARLPFHLIQVNAEGCELYPRATQAIPAGRSILVIAKWKGDPPQRLQINGEFFHASARFTPLLVEGGSSAADSMAASRLASLFAAAKDQPDRRLDISRPSESILQPTVDGAIRDLEGSLAQAQSALTSGALDQAEKLYRDVLSMAKDDPEAKRGVAAIAKVRANMARKTPVTEESKKSPVSEKNRKMSEKATRAQPDKSADRDLIEEAKARSAIEAQRLTRAVGEAIKEADRLAKTDPDAAINLLKGTLLTLEESSEGKDAAAAGLSRRVEQRLRTIHRSRQRLEAERLERDKALASADARRRRMSEESLREQTQKELMNRFGQLLAAGETDEAVRVAREVERLDPDDPAADAARANAELAGRYARAEEVELVKQDQWWRALFSVERSAIPMPDNQIITFPPAKEWEELSILRSKYKEAVDLAPVTPREADIRRALSRPITFEFEDTPLRDVMAFIKEYANINVILDPNGLAGVGVEPDQPVTLTLENVSLRSALNLMLDPLELTFSVTNDVLLITSKPSAEENLITKVYPVADLAIPISSFGQGAGIGTLGGTRSQFNTGQPGAGQGQGQGAGLQGVIGGNQPAGGRLNMAIPIRTKPSAQSPAAKPAAPVKKDNDKDKAKVDPAALLESSKADVAAWEKLLAAGELAPKTADAVLRLCAARNDSESAAALLKALVKSNRREPWAYEALAIALHGAGANEVEIRSAIFSLCDDRPDDVNANVAAATLLSRLGQARAAIELAKELLARRPGSIHAADLLLRLGEKHGDVDAAALAIEQILSRDWPIEGEAVHAETIRRAHALADALAADGKNTQADRLRLIAGLKREKDLVVTIRWQGEADVDLAVVEPGDILCSAATPRTVNGGVLAIDRVGEKEEYVATKALSGGYDVLIRPIWGTPTGEWVTLDIAYHVGAPNEKRDRRTIKISETDKPIRINLADGRRAARELVDPDGRLELAAIPIANARKEMAALVKEGSFDRRDPTRPRLADRAERQVAPGGAGAPLAPAGFAGGGGAVVGSGAVAFDPIISYVFSGPALQAQAFVSADRRYVRMRLAPVFQEVTGFVSVPITGAAR